MELEINRDEASDFNTLVDLLQQYRRLLEQPLDDCETEEGRQVSADQYYDDNIVGKFPDDQIRRALFLVF